MLVIGDSLAVGTLPHLAGLLPGRSVVSDVRNGITTPQGMRMLRRALRGQNPRTIVIQLGTNDGPDAGRFASRLRRTMAFLPDRACIVWSTIVRPRRKGSSGGLNRVLRAAEERYRRLVLVDWEGAVSRGSVRLRDGLHADAAGYVRRSELIARAVRGRCTPRGLGAAKGHGAWVGGESRRARGSASRAR